MPVPLRLLLCLCATTLAAPAARAEPVFAGAATRTSSLNALVGKVQSAAGQAFQRQGVTDVGKAPTAVSPQFERVEDLQRLLADARTRYLDGEFNEAVAVTDTAIERFEARFAYRVAPDAWATFGDLMLVRALALRRGDKESAGDETLTTLATLSPSYVPDPGLAPPKVAGRYQQMLKKLREKSVQSIEITSTPPGASVILDGRVLGATPLLVKDVLPGKHYLALELDEERVEKKASVLKAGEKFDFELGDPRSRPAGTLTTGLQKPIDEAGLGRLASEVGDDVFVLVVEPEKKGLLLLAGHIVRGKLVSVTGAPADVSLSGLDAVADTLVRTARKADRDGLVAGAAPLPGDLRRRFLGSAGGGSGAAEEEGPPVLLIVGIGAGVVAVAALATVGTLFLVNANQDPHAVVVLNVSGL